MQWVIKLITSSIGRKLVMSLTGLFLVSFLIVHLSGNLQLFKSDGGAAFNIYTQFMSTNPIIGFISYGLYFFIVLHTVQGIMLWRANKNSRSQKYAVNTRENASWASKNMALLGTLLLAFLCIHMGDFWRKIKHSDHFEDAARLVEYDGVLYKNAYQMVMESFSNPLITIVYLIGMVALGFHLAHGFQSAFQTLGLNHKKYTPLIKTLGLIFSILLPLVFAAIPIFLMFKS